MTASVDADPPYWMEISCFALFFVGMFVTCGAVTLVFWSVAGPYSGHFTAFHIVLIAVILIHGSVTGMMVLQFPFIYAAMHNLSKKKGKAL